MLPPQKIYLRGKNKPALGPVISCSSAGGQRPSGTLAVSLVSFHIDRRSELAFLGYCMLPGHQKPANECHGIKLYLYSQLGRQPQCGHMAADERRDSSSGLCGPTADEQTIASSETICFSLSLMKFVPLCLFADDESRRYGDYSQSNRSLRNACSGSPRLVATRFASCSASASDIPPATSEPCSLRTIQLPPYVGSIVQPF